MNTLEANETIEKLETAVMSGTANQSQTDDYYDACRVVCIERGNHMKMLTSSSGQDLCFECGSAN